MGSPPATGEGERARQRPWPARHWELILVALLAALLVFVDLGSPAFHDEDEALYAAVAIEMLEDGDGLTLRYWGEPFFHKPPLKVWITAASLALLPASVEFAARFPSAIAGLVTVLLTMLWARRLGGRGAGVVAGLTLLLGQQFLYEHAVRSGSIDAEVMLFSLAALLAATRTNERRAAVWTCALCLCALALLKSAVAALPLAAVLIYLVLSARRRLAGFALATLATGLVAVLPWHLHQLLVHGRSFSDVYIGYELLGRTGGAAMPFAPGRWVHLEALWQGLLPWTPLVIVAVLAVAVGLSRSPGKSQAQAAHQGDRLILLVFIAVSVGVLSLLRAKWAWYTLPLLPPLAIFAGDFVGRLLRGRQWHKLAVLAGTLLSFRLLVIERNVSYAPASRISAAWPHEADGLYLFAEGWPTPLSAVLALLGLCLAAMAVGIRSDRLRQALTFVLAAAIVAITAADLIEVPRDSEQPARLAAQTLEQQDYEVVLLHGFRHQARYAGRMSPIESVYLRSTSSRDVVDLDRDSFDSSRHPGRCALLTPAPVPTADPLARIIDECDLWIASETGATLVRRGDRGK